MEDHREAVARAIAPIAWNWYGKIGDNRAQEARRRASLKHADKAIAAYRMALGRSGFSVVPITYKPS
jgi:hypothetical protein